jgi:hypothetical protein
MSEATATWALVSDDELVALAHSRQGEWTRPLTTVDMAADRERADAVARGYRSLMLRGLLEEENPAGAGLLLPLSLVGARPDIMATWVTPALTQEPAAERFELFTTDEGQFIAVTTRPGGVHTFAPIDGQVGLSFFAGLAVAEQSGAERDGNAGLCILVRGRNERLSGGFVVRAGAATRLSMDPSGAVTEGGGTGSGGTEGGGTVAASTPEQWRREIEALIEQ